MNISAVSFGKRELKQQKMAKQPSNYYINDDVYLNNKNVEKPKKKKMNKFLLGLAALFCASNMTQCAKLPNTTNPNNATNSDLKTLYYFGNMVDSLDGPSSMDYTIEDTEQGKVADCWLLSTINSMRNTEQGKELISNMFEYKGDETVVHLFGVGDYTISKDELKIGKVRHSKGDDDMLLVELAVEKALADYNDGKLILPEIVIIPELGGNGTFSTLNLGSQDAAMYILTGKIPTYSQIEGNDEKVEYALSKLQENGDTSFILTASIETGDREVINQEGEAVTLKGHHAYSVLKSDDGYVTVINPEDASEEFCITTDSFKNAFSSITYMDMNDFN